MRQERIEKSKQKKIEELRKKQMIEDEQFKNFQDMKLKVKQDRLKGIMDAEAEINALNGIMHHIEVWNAWDRVSVDKINKFSHGRKLQVSNSCVNKNQLVNLLSRPKTSNTKARKSKGHKTQSRHNSFDGAEKLELAGNPQNDDQLSHSRKSDKSN